MKVAPDMATMTFGVQTSRPTAAEASTANTEAMNAVTAKLKSLGVAEEDMQTSDYSIYQDFQYDSKGNRTDVSTFTVSMNVTIKLYDMAKIGDVIDGAVAAGANSSYGIYFGLKDPNAKRAELMKEAVSDAQAKAEAMAEAAGMKLGKLVTLTDGSSSGDDVLYRTTRAEAEEAGATSGGTAEKSAADIQPGTLDLNASITARYIIE